MIEATEYITNITKKTVTEEEEIDICRSPSSLGE